MKIMKKVLALFIALIMVLGVVPTYAESSYNGTTIDLSITFSSDSKGANPITSVEAGSTFYMLVNFAGNPTTGWETTLVGYTLLFGYDPDKVTINAKLNSLTSPTFNPTFADGVFLGTWGSLDGIVNDDGELSGSGTLFRVKATAKTSLTQNDLAGIELVEGATHWDGDTQLSEIKDANKNNFAINWVPAFADDGTNGTTIDLSVIFSSDNKGANPITSVEAGQKFYMLVTFDGNPTDETGIVGYTLSFSYNPNKITINRKLNSLTSPTFNSSFAEGVFLGTWGSLDGIIDDDAEYVSEGILFRVEGIAKEALTKDDLANIELLASATGASGTQLSEIKDSNVKNFAINWVPTIEKGEEPTTTEIKESDFAIDLADKEYTGSVIEPSLSSSLPSDAYAVSYSNNIEVGTATITIEGRGNYTGTIVKHFCILARAIKVSDFTFDLADKTYTGSAIIPAVTSTLKAGTDYDVTYSNNVEVGTATITVTGKGNYAGTITRSFTIKSYDNTNDTTIDLSVIFSSDNRGETPITSVAAGETFYMMVNFAGNPTNRDSSIVAYTLLFGYDPDKITISSKLNGLTAPTFNPEFAEGVFLGAWASLDGILNEDSEITSEGKLFRVKATALTNLTQNDLADIKLIESATGVETQESRILDNYHNEFTINWVPTIEKREDPVDITWEDFDFSEFYPDYAFQYTGSPIEPAVISDTLVEGRDYTVTYRDNLYAGTAKVIINGIGNYAGGTIEVHFTIVPAIICEADFALAETSYVYTGCSINPEIITMLAHGIDFEVCYENNVDVGIATVVITAKGNYAGEVYFGYEILPKEITDADFALDLSNFVYTGSEITPEVISVIGLVECCDYEVCYFNNVNVGTATIAVAGKGNYTGTIVKTFTIRPVYATEADFVFGEPEEWYEAKIQAMELERGIEIEVTSAAGLVEGEDYEVVYTNNHAAGTAIVTVRGIGNYAGEVSKTFEIRTFRLGDVNNDETWSTLDAIRILKMATSLYTDYSDVEAKAAEVIMDGRFNAMDALEVLKYSALLDGTINRFYGEDFSDQ